MTLGLGRFEFYLIQIDDILLQASKTTNPALYLYEHDGRTKFFMLQGLAKLYTGLHNKKKFSKIKDHFKAIEDALGAIDHYDNLAKDFVTDKKIPAAISNYFKEQKILKFTILNTLLLQKKWINHHPLRTQKIRKKLLGADWQNQTEEKNSITAYYLKEIKDITDFYQNTGEAFTDIELQVHELRRLLRWLSIYPQALQGGIQLQKSTVKDKNVTKYLTPEIVNSSFNKMPAQGNCIAPVYLAQPYFLALSYIIAALGKLKDSGLNIMAIAEAIEKTEQIPASVALQKANKMLQLKTNGLTNILVDAKLLCDPFFAENNLIKLLPI